ncbi:MAG: YitT family protein [Clostridia bacterium]
MLRVRQLAIDFTAILFGSALISCGLVLFTIPNEIAPGGVTGFSTVLSYLTGLSVGSWSLLLNIPIIAAAWWKQGFRPLLKTMMGTILVSVFIDLFTPVITPYTNNPLLAAVLGGVLCGVGMGAIFARGASTGGTDLISLLLNRAFPNLSIGMLLLMVDATVVVFAVIVFRDIEVALYSIVTIFVTTKTIDSIMEGIEHAKVIYVVTERGQAINAELADRMERGVTMLDAKGGYTRRSKQLLMLVVRRNQFAQTMACIKSTDPDAFFFVSNATEVHGEGFKR